MDVMALLAQLSASECGSFVFSRLRGLSWRSFFETD
jgi:hypothetical protein